MTTIAEAKEYLRANYKKGTACPCCTQYVKLYKRKITSSMAYALILLYKSNQEWVHVQDYLKALPIPAAVFSCGVTTLRHWKLLEAKEGSKEDGNPNNGYYKLTQKGIDFVLNRISIEEHAFMFKDDVKRFGDTYTTIAGALKNKFNYTELMS